MLAHLVLTALLISGWHVDFLPLRWTSYVDLPPGRLDGIDEQLDKTQDERFHLTLVDEAGRERSPRTAREYLALHDAGYFWANNAENMNEGWFKKTAMPMRFLQRAKPARASFILDFKLERDALDRLPTSLGWAIGDDDAREDEIAANGGGWRELWPTSTVKVDNANQIRINDQTGGETIITVLAWGDLNGDGVEDLLLSASNYATEGTYKAYRYVIVTSPAPGAVLKVVEEWQ